MRRPPPPVVGLDQAELVLVAAQVLGTDPDDVLAAADVGVLTGIAARVRRMPSVADAAAEVLVGIAAGRPFGGSDAAVAWLAAVVLVERNAATIDDHADDWAQLVRAAADGSLGEREVAERIGAALRPQVGWARKALNAAWKPRAVALPSVHPCPVCGADVDRGVLWLFPAWAVPDRIELVAACARTRGTHDRAGHAVPERRGPSTARWCAVVLGPVEGGKVPFVTQTDRGALAFRPRPDGDGFDVVAIGALTPSDLVGSWAPLWARGHAVAHLAPKDCRFDIDRTRLDWDRVVEALPAMDLVPT